MRMTHPVRGLGLLLLSTTLTACIGLGPQSVAVTPIRAVAVWGGAGAGVGSAGFEGQLDLTRANSQRLLRLRFDGHTNLGGGWNPDDPPESVSELSLMAGRGQPCCGGNWGGWTVGGGLVSGSKGWSPAHEFHTIGLGGEAFIVSARFPHLAASVFTNLNTEMPFVGVNLALLFGRMPFVAVPPPMRGRFPPRGGG